MSFDELFFMMFLFISRVFSAVVDNRCVAPTTLDPEPPNLKLVHAQIITRHGQRTPLNAYLPYENRGRWECDSEDAISQREEANPNVFYRRYKLVFDDKTTSFPGNCRSGDLLIDGMKQHQALGQSYRKRFVDETQFLPSDYDPLYFYFTSSYIERTFRSQESFIVGLYPVKSNNEVIQSDMSGSGESPLFPNANICKEVKDQSNLYKSSQKYLNLVDYYDNISDAMTAVGLNDSPSDITNFCEWAVTTNCKIENSPSFLTQEVIDTCHEVFATSQFYKYSLGERGAAASYTLREMLHVLDKKLEGRSQVRFAHFSAHDTSLAAILMTLVPEQKFTYIPPFASHILCEVYKDDDSKTFIRYLYNGKIIRFEGTDENGLIEYTAFRQFINPFLEYCKEVPAPTD